MIVIFLETLVGESSRLRAAFVTDAALICIIVPPLLNLQRYAGVLENSPFLENANAIGMGLGFLAFSLAVADKMLMQRKEREKLLVDIQTAEVALVELEKTKFITSETTYN